MYHNEGGGGGGGGCNGKDPNFAQMRLIQMQYIILCVFQTCFDFYDGVLHDDYDCTHVFEKMNFIFYCKCHLFTDSADALGHDENDNEIHAIP